LRIRYKLIMYSSDFITFFFFFQAEDGIRDFHVTGVQTCALPISKIKSWHRMAGCRARLARSRQRAALSQKYAALRMFCMPYQPRSEERRVGKEWRSRRWTEH